MIIEVEYRGLKMLSGPGTHPGSGSLNSPGTDNEARLFLQAIEYLNNKENPSMVEVGCHWALWSLLFRNMYPKGSNTIVELSKHALSLAENNFKLNDFSFSSHWGGFFLEESGTYKNKENDIDFDRSLEPDSYVIRDLEGSAVGKELDFDTVIEYDFIDMMHLDIQGSEVPLLKNLSENGRLENIDMMVIATHSTQADELVDKIVNDHKYHKMLTVPFRGDPQNLAYASDGHHIIKRIA